MENHPQKTTLKQKMIGVLIIAGVCLVFVLFNGGHVKNLFSSTENGVVTKQEFKEMKDAKYEVFDMGNMVDKRLAKWVKEKEFKKGEHIYYNNEYSYVLISNGKPKREEVIMLNGVKKDGDTLSIGYSFKSKKELKIDVVKKENASILIRTKGEYKNIKQLKVK